MLCSSGSLKKKTILGFAVVLKDFFFALLPLKGNEREADNKLFPPSSLLTSSLTSHILHIVRAELCKAFCLIESSTSVAHQHDSCSSTSVSPLDHIAVCSQAF